ncbi:O-methyltransferase [Pseudoalteromonas sp. T1lg23B]|uniref:O-methyltransferase n=1 Tax=Pseudoalteromonas sp. T1lg23B TaxID=2077097 RepID=UPI00131A36CB|nr:O-methyltransferase [Pseudoalteromonas sp. T1lg23B]
MNKCCPKSYSVLEPSAQDYVSDLINPEDSQLSEIRKRSKEKNLPDISISQFDARHLEIISRIANPGKVVEVGTLAGYSTIALSRGLKKGGKLFTFENNPEHIIEAKNTFSKYLVEDKIQLIQGNAQDTLSQIERFGKFDLMFIDADKTSYCFYLHWATKFIRKGGLLIADNVFRYIHNRPFAKEVHQFNIELSQSPDWYGTYLPVEDGLAVFIRV